MPILTSLANYAKTSSNTTSPSSRCENYILFSPNFSQKIVVKPSRYHEKDRNTKICPLAKNKNLHFRIKMGKDFHRQTCNANSMKIFVIYVSTLRSYRVTGNVDKRFGYCNFAIYPISCISYYESTCIIRASISSFYFIINSV